MATQSRLLTLPPELLLSITDVLPADAIFALKLTHPVLNNMLPTLSHIQSTTTFTKCTRYAIERLQSPSSSSLFTSPPPTPPPHKRCTICKKKYPPQMFKSSSSPACIIPPPPPSSSSSSSSSSQQPYPPNEPLCPSDKEIITLPPFVCAWHIPRLTRIIRTGPGGRNEWFSSESRMCMHAGCVEGWVKCTCTCLSCGVSLVRTYTRFLSDEGGGNYKGFGFWRDGEDKLWVREVRGESFINLAVTDESDEKPGLESQRRILTSPWFQRSQFRWYGLGQLLTASQFLYTMRF